MTDLAAWFLSAVAGDSELAAIGSDGVGRAIDGALARFGEVLDVHQMLDLDAVPAKSRDFEMAQLPKCFVPADVRTVIAACLRGKQPAPSPRPGSAPPAPRPDRLRLDELLRRLTQEAQTPGAGQVMAGIGTLPGGVLGAIGIQPPPGSRWDVERVAKIIRDYLVEWLHRLQSLGLPGENSKRVMKAIDKEVTGPLQERLALAGALSIGAIAGTTVADLRQLIGLDSSPKVGMEVHERLQREYRDSRPSHLIVQESIVYFDRTEAPPEAGLQDQ